MTPKSGPSRNVKKKKKNQAKQTVAENPPDWTRTPAAALSGAGRAASSRAGADARDASRRRRRSAISSSACDGTSSTGCCRAPRRGDAGAGYHCQNKNNNNIIKNIAHSKTTIISPSVPSILSIELNRCSRRQQNANRHLCFGKQTKTHWHSNGALSSGQRRFT